MSVEQPLWHALTGYRLLTLAYALAVFGWEAEDYSHPVPGGIYLAALTVWTLLTLRNVSGARRCTRPFLVADISFALVGILMSPLIDTHGRVGPTLPSIWVAGPVLAFALKAGWRWAAGASLLVGIANVVERGAITRPTLHNALLVCVASVAIGYVVEVARDSERTLARALQIEAATRERERLARDIHDSVLQVLAMVQRRGTVLGGEAAELGRLAGEQEVALRTLVSEGVVPRRAPGAERRAAPPGADGRADPSAGGPAGGPAGDSGAARDAGDGADAGDAGDA
ncbi:DUF5931 domain-containing protein, partial [Streptomyces boncukensis]